MAIVVVLVLLVAVGIGVAVAISGKNKKVTSSTNSVVSPTRPNFTGAPLPKTQPDAKAQPAPGPFPLTSPGESRSAVMPAAGLPRLGLEGSTPPPLTEPAPSPALAAGSKAALAPAAAPVAEADRFAKVVGPTAAAVPPAKPIVVEAPKVETPEPPVETAAAVEPEPAGEPEPEVVEPAVVEPAVVVSVAAETAEGIEPESTPEPVEAEATEVAETAAQAVPPVAAAEAEVVIDLADETAAEVVRDLDLPTPLDEVETHEVDHVLKALIGRVRITHEDVDAVATELVDRADLDAEGVAGVLADLAEIAEATAEAERLEELTLFSAEVPNRPGQLTRFAELDDVERRRVIIRVLCLLVARADDASIDVTEDQATGKVRAAWPVDPDDADDLDLPTRLVKS